MIDPDALFDTDNEKAEEHATDKQKEAAEQLEKSTWNGMDKTEALLRLGSAKPSILQMEDGQHLVYPGMTHWFQGEPESLKSFMAQHAIAEELKTGTDCLYLDFESNIHDVVNRARSLGASHDDVNGHLEYVKPRVGTTASLGDMLAVERLITSRPWGLCVLDGVTGSFALEGYDPNSGAEVALWMLALPERIASTGAAVIVIDHVTKSTDGRGRWSIGSGHKLAALDGASYSLDNFQRLRRATPEDVNGVHGKSSITLNKDRGGWIKTGAKRAVGTFNCIAWPDDTLQAWIGEVEEGGHYSMDVIADVARILNYYPGMTCKSVSDRLEASEHEVNGAMLEMVGRKWLSVEQSGQSHKHTLTQLGRSETLDA